MYKTIKDVAENRLSPQRAAIKLDVTIRTVQRNVAKYNQLGKQSFAHKNKGRVPKTKISKSIRLNIIKLYQEKYQDSNFKHFNELLKEHENIHVSDSFIRTLMKQNCIISPKCRRATRKKHLKQLTEQDTKLEHIDVNKLNGKEIDYMLIDLCDAHPRRERAKYEGELIQIDASVEYWFGDTKTQLHAAIDDASGKIVGLFFDKQETLFGYQNLFHQILCNYGIPYEFFTDKRTVFEYNKKNAPSLKDDTFTQFGYSCHQLGTKITTSSIPQAKGRVERLFGTLQSRLPVELRIRNISTIEEANEFLPEFINKFNHQFALQLNNTKNAYENVENIDDLNLILSKIDTRKIDNGGCVSYKSIYYFPIDDKGKRIILPARAKVLIIDTFDNQLYLSVNETVYGLKELNTNSKSSRELDPQERKQRALAGKFTPAMSHPWKKQSFLKYLAKQKHVKQKQFERITQQF